MRFLMRLYKFFIKKTEVVTGHIWAETESDAIDILEDGEYPDDAEFKTQDVSAQSTGEFKEYEDD